MVQTGQDLTLTAEQALPARILGAAVSPLQRNRVLELAVRPMGEVHGRHATAIQFSRDPVWTDQLTRCQ